MARIEWAMWANEQGVASAVSKYSTSGLTDVRYLFVYILFLKITSTLATSTYSGLERFLVLNAWAGCCRGKY